MSNNQLQVYQGMQFGELTTQDIAVIRETIAKDANDSQFRLFMGVAKSSGANPLTNEIYAAVRGGQLTIQYGYDFYVRKAKEADGYLGYDVQLVHENDELKVSRKTDEQGRSYMVITDHNITFPRGKVIAAYAVAFREGVSPFTVFMEAEEVDHLRKSNIGMQKTMWTNYYGDMFKKHVLRRALKGQFGLEFDDQQVGGGDVGPEQPRERKDITPHQDVIDDPNNEPSGPSGPQPEPTEEEKLQQVRQQIADRFVQLGIVDKQEQGKYISENVKVAAGKKPTLAQMIALVKVMDMHIQESNSNDELE